jgi:hypothetical protein
MLKVQSHQLRRFSLEHIKPVRASGRVQSKMDLQVSLSKYFSLHLHIILILLISCTNAMIEIFLFFVSNKTQQ